MHEGREATLALKGSQITKRVSSLASVSFSEVNEHKSATSNQDRFPREISRQNSQRKHCRLPAVLFH